MEALPVATADARLASTAGVRSKRVAIVQSNYIPWKGYFDVIHSVDEFILYDDMQYTRRDWRNRNRIKTKDGLLWLTIPVEVKGRYLQKIKETAISDTGWNRHHWEVLATTYARTPGFRRYGEYFEALYASATDQFLSAINYRFLTAICRLLEIPTRISWSMDYTLPDGKTERLVDLCRQAGASTYLSGPAARDYLDESLFERAGIGVEYMDYSGYPEYVQRFGPFEHGVSILDLIFHTGPDARRYMKTF
jgi:hypothetical protein